MQCLLHYMLTTRKQIIGISTAHPQCHPPPRNKALLKELLTTMITWYSLKKPALVPGGGFPTWENDPIFTKDFFNWVETTNSNVMNLYYRYILLGTLDDGGKTTTFWWKDTIFSLGNFNQAGPKKKKTWKKCGFQGRGSVRGCPSRVCGLSCTTRLFVTINSPVASGLQTYAP